MNEIVTEIRLELDKLRSDLKESQAAAEASAKKTGQTVGDNIEEGLGKAFGGLKAAFLGLAGTIGAAFTLKESIAAASEQEEAINGLNSSLALAGNYSEQASARFIAFAGALQGTTTAADEAIIKGGALLSTMGKLSGDTLERATQASLDLSAALGIDQTSAFNIVAKAASGHVSALGRYGISVKQTGDQSRDFANALEELEGRFKGLAQLQVNTFAGAMTLTKNQFGEVLESLGNIVIKSPTVIAILKLMAETFKNAAAAIEKFASGRDLVGELSESLIEFGTTLITYVVAPLEMAYNIAQTVFNGIKTLIQADLVAITEGVSFITGLLANFGGTFAEIDTAVKTFAQSSGDVLNTFIADTKASADNIFNFDGSAKAEEYLGQMKTFVESVTPAVKTNFLAITEAVNAIPAPTFFSNFSKSFQDNAFKMMENAKNLGGQVNATLNTGLTKSFEAMGGAFAKGENGMHAFGKAMIGVLGDIALQFGAAFIALGVGKTLMFDPTGPLLVAAGAALAVLGGALKAMSGGGGGGTAGAGSATAPSTGGGVASGAGSGFAPTMDNGQNLNDAQRGEIGTKVEVNVQGNVFDRRETGMHIADVINEAFGSNGITFATGAT